MIPRKCFKGGWQILFSINKNKIYYLKRQIVSKLSRTGDYPGDWQYEGTTGCLKLKLKFKSNPTQVIIKSSSLELLLKLLFINQIMCHKSLAKVFHIVLRMTKFIERKPPALTVTVLSPPSPSVHSPEKSLTSTKCLSKSKAVLTNFPACQICHQDPCQYNDNY